MTIFINGTGYVNTTVNVTRLVVTECTLCPTNYYKGIGNYTCYPCPGFASTGGLEGSIECGKILCRLQPKIYMWI